MDHATCSTPPVTRSWCRSSARGQADARPQPGRLLRGDRARWRVPPRSVSTGIELHQSNSATAGPPLLLYRYAAHSARRAQRFHKDPDSIRHNRSPCTTTSPSSHMSTGDQHQPRTSYDPTDRRGRLPISGQRPDGAATSNYRSTSPTRRRHVGAKSSSITSSKTNISWKSQSETQAGAAVWNPCASGLRPAETAEMRERIVVMLAHVDTKRISAGRWPKNTVARNPKRGTAAESQHPRRWQSKGLRARDPLEVDARAGPRRPSTWPTPSRTRQNKEDGDPRHRRHGHGRDRGRDEEDTGGCRAMAKVDLGRGRYAARYAWHQGPRGFQHCSRWTRSSSTRCSCREAMKTSEALKADAMANIFVNKSRPSIARRSRRRVRASRWFPTTTTASRPAKDARGGSVAGGVGGVCGVAGELGMRNSSHGTDEPRSRKA